MATLARLTEEIRRKYVRSFAGGNIQPTLLDGEVRPMIERVTNELLSAEYKSASKVGMIDIPTCVVAKYAARAVATSGGVSTATMPVMPIRMPYEMGLWSVVPEQGVVKAYIPIPTGMADVLSGFDEMELDNQIGYRVAGRTVTFTKDLSALGTPVTSVTMYLLVADLSVIVETDPWPIAADMEAALITRVVELLLGAQGRTVKPSENVGDGASV
jgi:hypothetical protein